MKTYRISEVADRTGFSASTIRYYEGMGVIPPARRTEAGYRVYDERYVGRLAFVARAKRLGLRLEEISDLTQLWDGDDCRGVQQQMADLVAARLAETHERVADLLSFANELDAVTTQLSGASHPGPCDETCACNTEPSVPSASSGEPLRCSLPAVELSGRISDWQWLLARAISRDSIPGGERFRFAADAGLAAELADLAQAELGCCPFFDFTLDIAAEALTLDVRAPSSADVALLDTARRSRTMHGVIAGS